MSKKNLCVATTLATTCVETPEQELARLRAENAMLKSGQKPVKVKAPEPFSIENYKSGGVIVKGGALPWNGVYFTPEGFAFVKANLAKIDAHITANADKLAALRIAYVAAKAAGKGKAA
jgi:hypothetical protein